MAQETVMAQENRQSGLVHSEDPVFTDHRPQSCFLLKEHEQGHKFTQAHGDRSIPAFGDLL